MKRMLVAGVGNIFLSDDGFGSEVIRAMAGRAIPDGVDVIDFGIRGIHLAYQLLDGYEQLVIVDAAPRGEVPGTVSLIEVDQSAVPDSAEAVARVESPLMDAHGMEPGAILSMLGSIGGQVEHIVVVACEPECVDEGIGLSPVVAAAIPSAIEAVEQLMRAGQTSAKEVSR